MENISATKNSTVDSLTFKFFMEEGSLVDLKRVKSVRFSLQNKVFKDQYNFDNQNNQTHFNGDTLVFETGNIYQKFICGRYELEHIELQDESGNRIYELHKPIFVNIDSSCKISAILPRPQQVVESDRQAMFDLRDVLLSVDYLYAQQWKAVGDEIALWPGVYLNNEGRVIGMGYWLSDEDDGKDYTLNNKATKQNKTKCPVREVQKSKHGHYRHPSKT